MKYLILRVSLFSFFNRFGIIWRNLFNFDRIIGSMGISSGL